MTGRRILTGNFNQKCASCQHRAWARKNKPPTQRRLRRVFIIGATTVFLTAAWVSTLFAGSGNEVTYPLGFFVGMGLGWLLS